MRPPTSIFFTMLLGIVALLFGFGIAVVISGTAPDMLAICAKPRALSFIDRAVLHPVLFVTTKQASNSSTDQGGGKRRADMALF